MNKTIPASHVRIKRAYEAPMPEDGARILIDRLWPRGVKKEALLLAEWAKPLAPSTELRQWFNHDPALWDEFRRRYAAELRQQPQAWAQLRERAVLVRHFARPERIAQYLRISVGTPAQCDALVQALRAILDGRGGT